MKNKTVNDHNFIEACKDGSFDTVKSLLDDKRINPADKKNIAFILACEYGKTDIVKLLLDDKRINPADQDNYAFIYACREGNFDIVKLLFNDKRINPFDQNNLAFIHACRYGYVNIIKLFIEKNIYCFDFDYNSKEELYFLKKIYPNFKENIKSFLINKKDEEIISKLDISLIKNNISIF